MITLPSNERGLTFISFLIVAAMVGFLGMLALKIGPIYLDHYKVEASLKALKSDSELASRSKDEILRSLEKRWDIDSIESVTKENVIITKDYHSITIQVKYDVIKPIAGNISALVRFDDSIAASSN